MAEPECGEFGLYRLTTRWSGYGLSGSRFSVVEVKTGYENARSQDLSSGPRPVDIGNRSC